jgi:hypothetical protein
MKFDSSALGRFSCSTRVLLPFGFLNSQLRSLKTNLAVRTIAERFIHRAPAAAERECRFAGEVILRSVGIDKFDGPFRRFHSEGAVGANCDFNLSHNFEFSGFGF